MNRIFCVFLFLLALTACSNMPKKEHHAQPATQASAASDSKTDKTTSLNTHWVVKGKIAVQTPKNSGSALVDWSQRGNQYVINLQGPAGANNMYLTGGNGLVVLRMSDGKRFTAKTPEELLARQWGFQLPVSSLYYWIRGMAVPSIPAKTQYNDKHELYTLVQEGWKITYLSYTKVGGKMLPQKIYAYSNTLTVKVMIYNWII